jgi:hypothetical protein
VSCSWRIARLPRSTPPIRQGEKQLPRYPQDKHAGSFFFRRVLNPPMKLRACPLNVGRAFCASAGQAAEAQGAATHSMSMHIVEERQRRRCPPAAAPLQAAALRPYCSLPTYHNRYARRSRLGSRPAGQLQSATSVYRLALSPPRLGGLRRFSPLLLPAAPRKGCPSAGSGG